MCVHIHAYLTKHLHNGRFYLCNRQTSLIIMNLLGTMWYGLIN